MLKFAKTTTTVNFDGRIVRLAEGDPWHATDPFVIARPELFSDLPARVYGTRAVVEQASAAPGERRTVKRG